jgi:UDP-N-acetylmuramate--alanine ligase
MYDNYYFVGAGGIGMANLVRYYLSKNKNVAGYDRAESELTDTLQAEGADITYVDDTATIPSPFRNPETTLVTYTPAVPEDNSILTFFRNGGFKVVKRAALLGEITRSANGICVAGSHGKTTTCSMIANIMRGSQEGCNAFLGGILRNVNSNLVLTQGSRWAVIEADEYDRSFHHLSPYIAVVTSADPDHLDIYGNEENYLEAFTHFTELIRPGGTLIIHTGLKVKPNVNKDVTVLTYSGSNDGDCHADNIRFLPGRLLFDYVYPEGRINDIEVGVPVEINIDNAVAACTAARIAGTTEADIKEGLKSFMGAKRRFEIHLRGDDHGTPVFIDDYAHSPNEIKASIESVRKLYPNKKISVIFQPHLYTRTRDFADEFAKALSESDEVILLEIYPARELPIDGVTSEIIFRNIKCNKKTLCERKNLLNLIKNSNFEILMTLGAADIDRLIPNIKEILTSHES